MPELPEVETVRLQLMQTVVGLEIDSIEIFHPKTVAFDTSIEKKLVNKTIKHIDRIGKLMIFSFKSEDDLFLLAHLKMTGQFFYRDDTGKLSGGGHSMTETDFRELPGKYTRVAFHFTDDSSLFFNDMRLFGYTKLSNAEEVAKARKGFGPEPIALDFDCAWFVDAVRKRKAPIKAVLLDQKFVAGLGNIYVDEALWRAKVKPTRRADRVTKAEAAELCSPAGDVMRESIKAQGTTFKDFKDVRGKVGNFTNRLQVFGKQGTPCPRCGETIVKIRAAGRGTHFCPGCQK